MSKPDPSIGGVSVGYSSEAGLQESGRTQDQQADSEFNDASILVTGGTGSFGRVFARIVLSRYKPRRLVIFSRDELKQYEMAQEFSESEYPCVRYFIGDIRDESRLKVAMKDVDYVVHAAALKHVPTAEYNPFECIKTNVYGAQNVVTAAQEAGVRKVVALSTDKAANPINLYGASKLASDKIFIAANNMSGLDGTRFGVARYGNVVNSRGSVIPFFKKLIDAGENTLPVTDQRMTRFWITISQGVDLVLSSMSKLIGGEIFVPKVPSMKIVDVAQAMLPGCELKVIGIRPGEKLHEVMVPREDGRLTLDMGDRYVIEPAFQFWDRDSYRQMYGGEPVDHEFQYGSDTNDWWLSAEELHQMLGTSV